MKFTLKLAAKIHQYIMDATLNKLPISGTFAQFACLFDHFGMNES